MGTEDSWNLSCFYSPEKLIRQEFSLLKRGLKIVHDLEAVILTAIIQQNKTHNVIKHSEERVSHIIAN